LRGFRDRRPQLQRQRGGDFEANTVGGRGLRTFTLATNCLIDVEENRPPAAAIRALATAHTDGVADVAVIAMSASENPKPGQHIHSFSEFEARLAVLGLAHLSVVLPMLYFDISFWDRCLLSDESMVDFECQIHAILFPNVQFLWQDYCRDSGIDPPPSSLAGKWRNCKCDVQAIWSHIHGKRDVFVTSDRNFHNKRLGLIALGAGKIEYPDDAVNLVGGDLP
jgi:hypothetical protein